MKIEQYLDQLSREDCDKQFYIEKIKKYRAECGCTLSGIFFIAAIAILGTHIFQAQDASQISNFKSIFYGFSFILISAFVGKVIGLALAGVKLQLLYIKLILQNKRI